MKIAVMQPYLFPYLGYFQLVNYVDIFVFFDDVNYIKKGYINRNTIELPDGRKHQFTLPIKKASQNTLIKDVELSKHSNKILETIESAYKKREYFKETISLVRKVLNPNIEYQEPQYEHLSQVIEYSVKSIASHLNIKTGFYLSSDLQKRDDLKGQDKILEICRLLGAKTYVNPIGGFDLYDNEKFESNGVKIEFLEYFGENKLSVIDVLMKNGKEQTNNMLHNYGIKKKCLMK